MRKLAVLVVVAVLAPPAMAIGQSLLSDFRGSVRGPRGRQGPAGPQGIPGPLNVSGIQAVLGREATIPPSAGLPNFASSIAFARPASGLSPEAAG
jgi:hypothetical protein